MELLIVLGMMVGIVLMSIVHQRCSTSELDPFGEWYARGWVALL
jgi:hypothetical protein